MAVTSMFDFLIADCSMYCWQAACEEATQLCKAQGKSIAKLALQYAMRNRDITVTLVGMNSVEQVCLHLTFLFTPHTIQGSDPSKNFPLACELILARAYCWVFRETLWRRFCHPMLYSSMLPECKQYLFQFPLAPEMSAI